MTGSGSFGASAQTGISREEVNYGAGGIRTLGAVTRTPHFQCGPFSHSDTAPKLWYFCIAKIGDDFPAPAWAVGPHEGVFHKPKGQHYSIAKIGQRTTRVAGR